MQCFLALEHAGDGSGDEVGQGAGEPADVWERDGADGVLPSEADAEGACDGVRGYLLPGPKIWV
jgi:hypothetical protein